MKTSLFRLCLRSAFTIAACGSTLALVGCSSAGLVSTQGSSASGDAGAATADANGGTAQRPHDADAADAAASVSASTDLHGTFTAKGASFDTSLTDREERMLDIVFADSLALCSSPRTASSTPVFHVTLRAAANTTFPGTYSIVHDSVMGGSGAAPSGTAVMWSVYDGASDACSLTNTDELAGTVTITEASATRVTGTLSLTSATQNTGSIQGTFSAQACHVVDKRTFACPLAI